MDRLDALQALVFSKELGSFAAAARKLGLTRSQISKRISWLEEEYGVSLFIRSTRSIVLSSSGMILYEYALQLLDLANDARNTMSSLQKEVTGVLWVNAPVSFSQKFLNPLIPKFLQLYPSIELRLELSDQFIDPFRQGFDLTLRIGELEDSSYIAKKICTVPKAIYCAPSYQEKHGYIKSPQELERHDCLTYGHSHRTHIWNLTNSKEIVNVRANGSICSNNADILIQASIAGVGVILLPTFLVSQYVEAQRLVNVLPDWEPLNQSSLYVLYASRMQSLSAAARTFIDFLTSNLRI